MSERKTCGAKKKNGQLCQSPFTLENGRCKVHGGMSLRGEAHPNYKHGRTSRYAPRDELGRLYERAKQDTDLRNLSDDLALVTAFINERLETLDTMGGIDFFKDIATTADKMRKAHANQDMDELYLLIAVLDGMANKGKDHLTQLDAIVKLIEQRRKLSDSQSKRENEERLYITTNQMMFILNSFIAVVFDHIHSARVKNEIYKAYEKLLSERLPASTDAFTIPSEASGASG